MEHAQEKTAPEPAAEAHGGLRGFLQEIQGNITLEDAVRGRVRELRRVIRAADRAGGEATDTVKKADEEFTYFLETSGAPNWRELSEAQRRTLVDDILDVALPE